MTLLRFDSNEHLENWLDSAERKELLREADGIIDRSTERRVRTSFEGWFKFGADDKPPPSWKQAAIVLLVSVPGRDARDHATQSGTQVDERRARHLHRERDQRRPPDLAPDAARDQGDAVVALPAPGSRMRVRWGGPALLISLYALAIVFFHFFTGWVHISPITSL